MRKYQPFLLYTVIFVLLLGVDSVVFAGETADIITPRHYAELFNEIETGEQFFSYSVAFREELSKLLD